MSANGHRITSSAEGPTLACTLLLCKLVASRLSRLTSSPRLVIFATSDRASVLRRRRGEASIHSAALKVGETRSWRMIMQGGLHMVSFRKVAVFISVVGLLSGVASIVDAAHTK